MSQDRIKAHIISQAGIEAKNYVSGTEANWTFLTIILLELRWKELFSGGKVKKTYLVQNLSVMTWKPTELIHKLRGIEVKWTYKSKIFQGRKHNLSEISRNRLHTVHLLTIFFSLQLLLELSFWRAVLNAWISFCTWLVYFQRFQCYF